MGNRSIPTEPTYLRRMKKLQLESALEDHKRLKKRVAELQEQVSSLEAELEASRRSLNLTHLGQQIRPVVSSCCGTDWSSVLWEATKDRPAHSELFCDNCHASCGLKLLESREHSHEDPKAVDIDHETVKKQGYRYLEGQEQDTMFILGDLK